MRGPAHGPPQPPQNPAAVAWPQGTDAIAHGGGFRKLWSIFYMTAEGKPEGWAGRDRNLWASSAVEAIDYRTGAIRWRHEIGEGEGVSGSRLPVTSCSQRIIPGTF